MNLNTLVTIIYWPKNIFDWSKIYIYIIEISSNLNIRNNKTDNKENTTNTAIKGRLRFSYIYLQSYIEIICMNQRQNYQSRLWCFL